MKRYLILPLIISLIFSVSCINNAYDVTSKAVDETTNVLLVGLDDAAQNMDVLCFASYIPSENKLSFVQVPRDTYFDFGGTQNKINQIYAFYRATLSQKDAMTRATAEIAQAMSVPLDGYLAITTKGLAKGIDAIGGVDIDVAEDGMITDELGENLITLHTGRNHLSGEACVQFLRYRKGYLTGDLGRLDAQKLFLRGMIEKFSVHLTVDSLMQAVFAIKDDIITDLNLFDWIKITSGARERLSEAGVSYLTLPGEAVISSRGLSYYVLNKKCAKEIAEEFLSSQSGDFDKEEKFLNKKEISFINIYNDKNNNYRVYHNDTLGTIHIPKKQKS